ncbi:MAG: SH3 domain-containing protein [Arachnia sp.]
MSAPRRAAETPTIVASTDAPQPARRGSRPRIGRIVAPLAALAVVATAAVVVLDPQDLVTSADPPLQSGVSQTTSRDRERSPLPSPPAASSPAASPSPSISSSPAASVSPSATAAASQSPSAAEPSPSASPVASTATPTPAPSSTPPEVDYTALADKDAELYATSGLNLRSGPGTSYDVISTVATGTGLTTTTWDTDGWQQISYNGKALWVSAKYLSSTKPTPTTRSDSSSGIDTSECRGVAGIESGLTQRAVTMARAVCNASSGVSSYGGYRSGSGSLHNSGRAIDAMISGDAGWQVANWARDHASELGIVEILYAQKIWTSQRAGEGWRSVPDRGNATANHYDHVHIGVK